MTDSAPDRLRATPTRSLQGAVQAPGDKSISHRALILGSLASGSTEITGLLEGNDVLATARAASAFGATVERTGDGRWRVEGRGGFAEPKGAIDCGNSGTGVRLLMGAASGYPITARFTGDSSLSQRPMRRVLDPLAAMGARVEAEGGRLPAVVHGGGLRGIDYTPPVASAQVKSAILLAGLNAEGETRVREPAPTRDHTERMLAAFGAPLVVQPDETGGRSAILRGGGRLSGQSVRVPGDPSSAAFPLVAALITAGSEVRVEGVLLNPLRAGLYDTLREMGADLGMENAADASGEPVADLVARSSSLRGVVAPAARAPSMIDEYPILAVAAAFAEGETVMEGVEELRHKESDRIALMEALLRACGVEVESAADRLVVHGRGRQPRGGCEVVTHGDHRVAMSGLVLGLGAEAPVSVDEAGMIATSFPGFAALMRSLGARID